MNRCLIVLAILLVTACAIQKYDIVEPSQTSSFSSRYMAITIDDLPVVRGGNTANQLEITNNILNTLKRYNAPATGFVNAGRNTNPNNNDLILRQWLEADMDLGNHTYSHISLFHTPLADYEKNVIRGERLLRRLMAEFGKTLTYFRHPYLNTGPNLETKEKFESFLTAHDYIIAPVTIDNSEWLYALAYDNAAAKNNADLMSKIGTDYIRHMKEMVTLFETISTDLLNRDMKQILLIHANALNAAYLDQLLNLLKNQGYQFVTLSEALTDPAYHREDNYVGKKGVSWLQRWLVSSGQTEREEPTVPE